MRLRVFVGIAVALLIALVAWPVPLVPDFATVKGSYRSSDLVVRAADGTVLQELRVSNEARRFQWVELSSVPEHLQRAVIHAEDRRFLTHRGVDWRSVARALVSGSGRGASTVTMQLASLIAPELKAPRGGRRSYLQKLVQMRWARTIEQRWTKGEIMEAYLNLVPLRGEGEGISGGARLLLGKTVEGLSPEEGVVLAALIRAPNARPLAVAKRGCHLKASLEGAGMVHFASPNCDRIDEIVARLASEETVTARNRVTDAPHLARFLNERSTELRDVVTTLDASLQRFVSEQLRAQLVALNGSNVADGAALVVRNDTGAVLAYVGNGGMESSARYVDGVRARRQAGSTLKPFLYALAFERRLLAADTLLNDAPLDIPVGVGVYRPKNYDRSYKGLVSVRTALAASLNVPAVLSVQRVGVSPFVELLGKLHFGALQRPDVYGPSVALGSPVVSLWELVNAYRALANGGRISPLSVVINEPSATAVTVLDPGATFIVADILSDRASRSVTFGLENALSTPYWTAVKTGTSKDMTDNWCVGFSREYTVGVWVGNFSGAPMHDVSGVTGAAPLWARTFDFLAKRPDFEVAAPPIPESLVVRSVNDERAVYLPGTEPVRPVIPIESQLRTAAIVSPVEGEIFAIDPDVPAASQKVVFESVGGMDGIRWVLNGRPLGPAQGRYLWSPEPGHYTLSMRTSDGRDIGIVRFSVRGGVVKTAELRRG